MTPSPRAFPDTFDGEFAFGTQGRCRGLFGHDVLRGLVSGIDEFRLAIAHERDSRTLGPAMLAAFMWLDDDELIKQIAEFTAACAVITKQPRDRYQQARINKLKPLLEQSEGFPARAIPELSDLVLREGGRVPVIGPYSPRPDVQIPALRTVGYRRIGKRQVPILHTKMVLLGELWWHDEDALGHVDDVIGFTPRRLWLGSANGTTSSRHNLEFGIWLDDPTLLSNARRFLVEVLRHSEDLDPDAHEPEPDLVEPDYDDEAFLGALASLPPDDEGPW